MRNDLAERRRSVERMQSDQVGRMLLWYAYAKIWLSRRQILLGSHGSPLASAETLVRACIYATYSNSYIHFPHQTTEMSSTKHELAGLEALEYQMARNLEALKEQQREASYSKTVTGRLINWGGCLFAVYCVYRIIVVRNLLRPSLDFFSPLTYCTDDTGNHQPRPPPPPTHLALGHRQPHDGRHHHVPCVPAFAHAHSARRRRRHRDDRAADQPGARRRDHP